MAGPGPGGRVKRKPKTSAAKRRADFARAATFGISDRPVAGLTAKAQLALMRKADPKGTTRLSEFVRKGGRLSPAQLKRVRQQGKKRDPKSTVRRGERGPKFE